VLYKKSLIASSVPIKKKLIRNSSWGRMSFK